MLKYTSSKLTEAVDLFFDQNMDKPDSYFLNEADPAISVNSEDNNTENSKTDLELYMSSAFKDHSDQIESVDVVYNNDTATISVFLKDASKGSELGTIYQDKFNADDNSFTVSSFELSDYGFDLYVDLDNKQVEPDFETFESMSFKDIATMLDEDVNKAISHISNNALRKDIEGLVEGEEKDYKSDIKDVLNTLIENNIENSASNITGYEDNVIEESNGIVVDCDILGEIVSGTGAEVVFEDFERLESIDTLVDLVNGKHFTSNDQIIEYVETSSEVNDYREQIDFEHNEHDHENSNEDGNMLEYSEQDIAVEDQNNRIDDKLDESVGWDYFNKFRNITNKYMSSQGEGETIASQIVTAVNKLIYKWYNDGDVYDNSNYNLQGWANDLSSYANWLANNVDGAKDILDRIFNASNNDDYEQILKDLADECLDSNVLEGYSSEPKSGSIYDCDGDYTFDSRRWEDDEYDESEQLTEQVVPASQLGFKHQQLAKIQDDIALISELKGEDPSNELYTSLLKCYDDAVKVLQDSIAEDPIGTVLGNGDVSIDIADGNTEVSTDIEMPADTEEEPSSDPSLEEPEDTNESEHLSKRRFNLKESSKFPNDISKFIYDLGDEAWSVTSETKDATNTPLLIISKNGKSNLSMEDIIDKVLSKYSNLKVKARSEYGTQVGFTLKESSRLEEDNSDIKLSVYTKGGSPLYPGDSFKDVTALEIELEDASREEYMDILNSHEGHGFKPGTLETYEETQSKIIFTFKDPFGNTKFVAVTDNKGTDSLAKSKKISCTNPSGVALWLSDVGINDVQKYQKAINQASRDQYVDVTKKYSHNDRHVELFKQNDTKTVIKVTDERLGNINYILIYEN